ncbi:MAG: hypothetical protein HFI29_03370 [Lachnospiraceae bacterium]|jgi:hypothetical protein|nr:hypothetical protein [Lachnospiraceae bacterium]
MIEKINTYLEALKQDPENQLLKKELQNNICNLLIEEVKRTEQPYDFETWKTIYPNTSFWELIEAQVNKKTQIYLFLTEFRNLPFRQKSEYLKKIFFLNYEERESISYAVEQLKISKNLAASIFQILTYSEDLILNRYVSKRRFSDMMYEITGLSEKETALLWSLYEEHQQKIEPMIHAKKMVFLEQKINRLESQYSSILNCMDRISDVLTLMVSEAEE